MIRDTNCYFLMREFICYAENYDEKLRKHGTCKVSIWAVKTKLFPFMLASRTSFLSYNFHKTSVLIIEVKETPCCLPIPSLFFPF